MIGQLLLALLLIIFTLGCIGIVLCQVNIFWHRHLAASRNNTRINKAKPLQLKVVQRRDLSERHFSVRLQSVTGEPLADFSPGQYLTVIAPTMALSGSKSHVGQKRCYSLASWHKNIEFYELGIQRETQGQVSNWLYLHLQKGAVISVLPPKGNFVIDPKQVDHMVLVAGGIGITPLRAMVHQFIAPDVKRSSSNKTMSLFYSAKSIAEMCYLDEFTQLAKQHNDFDFYPFISNLDDLTTKLVWQGSVGRLSANQLNQKLNCYSEEHQSERSTVEDEARRHYCLCGPNGMMDDISHGLTQQGVPASNIHFERFGITNDLFSEDKFSIDIKGSKSIFFQSHRTLLDAMEEQGVEIQSECRTGECGQCKIKIQKGTTKRLIKTDVPLNKGEVLSCCSIPESDLQIEL
tara:strand:+ start:5527 stop:6741 length:1215 start_codon:yes stop_codon:yes gene_type:complete